jgi:hypothetical protein
MFTSGTDILSRLPRGSAPGRDDLLSRLSAVLCAGHEVESIITVPFVLFPLGLGLATQMWVPSNAIDVCWFGPAGMVLATDRRATCGASGQ